MKEIKYKESKEWKYIDSKNHFCIVIKTHECSSQWIWNIYVYLYPKYRNFELFENNMRQELPFEFHHGCSYSRFHCSENGEITSKQYGCDYNHYWDEGMYNTPNPDDWPDVFKDAENITHELVEYSKYNQNEVE